MKSNENIKFDGGKNKMNKLLSLFGVVLMTLLIMSTSFAVAVDETDEVPENQIPVDDSEEELQEEINDNTKIPFVNVVSAWQGFIINENETQAEHLRLIITKQKYRNVLSVMNQETLQTIQEIRETETAEQAREMIRNLLQERVEQASEDTTVGGMLVIGKGENHETYRVVATEITEETAIFEVYALDSVELKTKAKGLGLFNGIRKAFGLATEEETTEVEQEVNTDEIEPIGTLTLDRNQYEHVEIGYGELVLEEGEYEGTWQVTASSQYKVPVYKRNQGQGQNNGQGQSNGNSQGQSQGQSQTQTVGQGQGQLKGKK